MSTVFREGATALISGGASGVGFAMAMICRRHGMHLALLDRDGPNLSKAADILSSSSNNKTTTKTKTETYELDVKDLSSWHTIRDRVTSTFGGVDLLMLNAGASPKPSTATPYEDPEYFHATLDTNLFGPINGLSTFLPLVRSSSGPSAIIMTGSKQGITNPPGNPAYNASKSALKTIAECLSHDLRTKSNTAAYAPHVSVHLLVPGWTFTGLSGNKGPIPDAEALEKKPQAAWLPSQCAEYGYEGIKKGKFYLICPDNDVDESLDQARMTWGAGDWIDGRSALSRWDDEWKDRAADWIGAEAGRRRAKEGDTTKRML